MLNNELDRTRHLIQSLSYQGIKLEDFLRDEYPAVVLHSSSTIITANQVAAELLGYSIDELQGLNAWILFPTHSAKVVTHNLQIRSELPYQVDVLRKDGELAHMELLGYNFEIEDEPVRAILFKALTSA